MKQALSFESGVAADVALAAATKATVPILGGGLVPDRACKALPALTAVAATTVGWCG